MTFNQFTEGQKKATSEEWIGKEKKSVETLTELKKDIKNLTGRLISRINVTDGKYSNEVCEAIRTVNYPQGAGDAQKALEIYDLRIINQTKQYDLLEAQVAKRKQYYNKLLRERAELVAIQNDNATDDQKTKSKQVLGKQNQLNTNQAPLTVEEDENRKLICHLENEIMRVNVQWSQAEHIRKKYKAIKASLMSDAEKFEKNLLELETALKQQNTDIENMKVG